MKDISLYTVGESGADPVPLRGLVEGLHYSEMQTSDLREQLSSWSLNSGVVCQSTIWVLASASRIVGARHLNASAARALALFRA